MLGWPWCGTEKMKKLIVMTTIVISEFSHAYLKQHLLIGLLSDRHVLADGESLFANHYYYKVVTKLSLLLQSYH